MILLTACGGQTIADSEQTTKADEVTPIPTEKTVDTMEDLTKVNGVVSVAKQTFSSNINGAVAYKVIYESENGKLSADVVLPKNYADKNHSVLIYFPETRTDIESLARDFALNEIIVIRPYARGYDESEGVRDLGGQKDLADSKKLLEIFDSATFVENSKIFVAGSSEGSVNALRLLAEDTEKRISGCAVVDIITDVNAFGVARGESIKNLFAYLIGKTYEEAPEEYDLRSAVKFSEKLDRPILMLHYTGNTLTFVEQTDALYELIKDNDCTYYKIDEAMADFHGTGLKRLLSWLNRYEQNETEYIVHTDWITFHFSKNDFDEQSAQNIASEAVSVMKDIRKYLNVNYTLQDAENAVCYFDSSYRIKDGQNRSWTYWNERKMYCISLGDFTHEYVHLVSECNRDLVYHPDDILSEGLAEYISLNFYDGIASKDYNYFKARTVSEDSNPSEHKMICDLLTANELEYNAKNYNKAFVALLDKSYGVSRLGKDNDIYKYYVGYVFVEYCVKQLGSFDKFISVYCDSVKVDEIYGKSVDKLVSEACAFNTAAFYGK